MVHPLLSRQSDILLRVTFRPYVLHNIILAQRLWSLGSPLCLIPGIINGRWPTQQVSFNSTLFAPSFTPGQAAPLPEKRASETLVPRLRHPESTYPTHILILTHVAVPELTIPPLGPPSLPQVPYLNVTFRPYLQPSDISWDSPITGVFRNRHMDTGPVSYRPNLRSVRFIFRHIFRQTELGSILLPPTKVHPSAKATLRPTAWVLLPFLCRNLPARKTADGIVLSVTWRTAP